MCTEYLFFFNSLSKMVKCNKKQLIQNIFVSIVSLAAILNIIVCAYFLFFIDVGALYSKINNGFALVDKFFGNVEGIVKVAKAINELQGVAYSLNTSIFTLQDQLGTYLPKIDLALKETFDILQRLNGTARNLETTTDRLMLPGIN